MGANARLRDGGSWVIAGVPGWEQWSFSVSADIDTVSVTAPTGQQIDAATWRALPIGAVLAFVDGVQRDAMLSLVTLDAGQPERRQYGGSEAHSAQVARLYRAALARRVGPLDAVQQHFGVSRRTAERRITDARRTGFLGTYGEEKRKARVGND